MVEDFKPVTSETNIRTNWCIDDLLHVNTVHLIEIDSVASDSVQTHITLNDEICHAKLDTGAQINVMTKTLFKCITRVNKLPLFLKSDVKLVRYGNKNIDYVGTTVLNVSHLNESR